MYSCEHLFSNEFISVCRIYCADCQNQIVVLSCNLNHCILSLFFPEMFHQMLASQVHCSHGALLIKVFTVVTFKSSPSPQLWYGQWKNSRKTVILFPFHSSLMLSKPLRKTLLKAGNFRLGAVAPAVGHPCYKLADAFQTFEKHQMKMVVAVLLQISPFLQDCIPKIILSRC